MAPTYEDLHLLIVGDTQDGVETRDLAAMLRSQAAQAGVADRVTFTGRVPQVEPYYHFAHIYAQASQHEGFGVPLVEAMAAGVPVVASADGAMPWLLGALDDNLAESGQEAAGLLALSGDAGDLARQIARLLAEPELRTTMVKRGRRRAQEFGRQQFVARAQKIIEEAAELSHQDPSPGKQQQCSIYRQGDIALRDYTVRSRLPLIGRLVERLRIAATLHLKEAYLDRMIEQQVNYNRAAARELETLQAELKRLQAHIDRIDGKGQVEVEPVIPVTPSQPVHDNP